MSEPTGTGPATTETRGSGVTGATAWTGTTPAHRPTPVTALTAPHEVQIVPRVAAPVPVVETADEIAALVLAVPGVTELHSGRFGEVATYLPGRRVAGVKLAEDRVEVHVVLVFGTPIRSVAQQIHAAVFAVVQVPVQVFIEDLAAPAAA